MKNNGAYPESLTPNVEL